MSRSAFSFSHLEPFVAHLLLMILTIVLPILAIAGNTCEIQEVDDPAVAGRAFYVNFPDGRKIEVVGHLHGERQVYDLLRLTNAPIFYTMSNQEFSRRMKQILNENEENYRGYFMRSVRRTFVDTFQEEYGVDASIALAPERGYDLDEFSVISQAQEDLDYIQRQVDPANPNPPKFIGWEGSEESLQRNYIRYQKVRQTLLREFNRRATRPGLNINQADVEEILLSSSNANTYLFAQNPRLARRVELFGTEDHRIGEAYDRAVPLSTMQEAFEAFDSRITEGLRVRRQNGSPSAWSHESEKRFAALLIGLHMDVKHMLFSHPSELEDSYNRLLREAPSWAQDEARSLVDSYRTRVRLNRDRDRASAENMADRYQNGIHFVGLNHLRSTMGFLRDRCLSEQSVTRVPTEGPSRQYSNPQNRRLLNNQGSPERILPGLGGAYLGDGNDI